jgi:plasmid stabilization system protein ParE
MSINFTPEAISDLVRLREFIAEKNPLAAQKAANEILAGLENLKVFPRMGLPVSSAPDPEAIRDLFIGDYTARYLVTSEQFIILRVWHGRETKKDS